MLVKKINKKGVLIAVSLGIFIFLGAVFLFANNNPALAQSATDQIAWGGQQVQVENNIGLSSTDPRIIIARIIQVFLGFLGTIALVLIIYAGFLWMTSSGDDTKIQQAKDILKNAVIGLIIILSSFAIASFILNMLLNGRAGGGPGAGGGPTAGPVGTGAIGSCAIVDYYPVLNQKDVVRNTAIMVTFREAISMNSVVINVAGDVNTSNIKLFDKCVATCNIETGSGCNTCLVPSIAKSTDNKNLVIMPKEYLGSASANTNYYVVMSNNIKKADGKVGIFDSCTPNSAYWTFEVGTTLDFDPPQVRLRTEGGMFPMPDGNNRLDSFGQPSQNKKDVITTVAAATSTGMIIVNKILSLKTVTYSSITGITKAPGSPWDNFSVSSSSIDKTCDANGLRVAVDPTLTPSLSAVANNAKLGVGVIDSDGTTLSFDYCNLKLVLVDGGSFDKCKTVGNCVWDIATIPYQEPDWLMIDGVKYTFVKNKTNDQEIALPNQIGANVVLPIVNAMSLVVGSPVNLSVDTRLKWSPFEGCEALGSSCVQVPQYPEYIYLKAKKPGVDGNRIDISTNRTDFFHITQMAGGQEAGFSVSVNGVKDEPRNAIIKMTFNDQMLPMVVAGDAEALKDKLSVQCFSGNCTDPNYFFDCDGTGPGTAMCVKGKFLISNQYKTVEFQSNNKCGVNGCGEAIYCLPGNSNLVVNLKAATLTTCTSDNDCTTKSPYNKCAGSVGNKHCQNDSGINYPTAVSFDGVMDKARNSLDGNRDNKATGSLSVYYENGNAEVIPPGDSFKWSFYISDEIDLTPPVVNLTTPAKGTSNIASTTPVLIDFSKIMMSSSLIPGYREVESGDNIIKHKTLNIWPKAGFPLGYWVTSDDANGKTKAQINHSYFLDYNDYRSQTGSGVKDAYQNCFKPSAGPSCTGAGAATSTSPSCCNGSATSTLSRDGNCTN